MNDSLRPGRRLSLIFGALLLAIALALGLALASAAYAFDGLEPLGEAAQALIDAFGLASPFLPLWLLAQALLLLAPGFRPEAHFLLAGSLLPFVAFVATLRLLEERALAERIFGGSSLGLPLLVAAGAIVVALSAGLVVRLRYALFPRHETDAAVSAFDEAAPKPDAEPDRARRALTLLDPPRSGYVPILGGGEPAFGQPQARDGDGWREDTPGASNGIAGLGMPKEGEFGASGREAPGFVTPASPDFRDEALADVDGLEPPEAGLDDRDEPLFADDEEPILVRFSRSAEREPEAGAAALGGGRAPAATKSHPAHTEDSARPALIREPVRSGVAGGAPGELPPAAKLHVETVPPAPRREDPPALAGHAVAPRPLLGRKTVPPYSVPTAILTQYPDGEYWIVDDKTRRAAEVLRETLREFHIEAEVTGIRKGPVITMFEILPAPGVKLSKITNLADNIALRLAASSVRIVAPIPGKHAVGIEVPNERRNIVSFRELVENDAFRNVRSEIPVALGKDIAGEPQIVDLVQTPHLLIAGATGSGKSVCVNALILSILYRRAPSEVRLILIDPKIVELKLYNGIAHLLTPVITEPKKAFQALQYCICEMERRYSLLDHMGVRDIRSYNRKIAEKKMATERLPYIVVVIDEFADLMATTGKELESTLARLAAMSRAIGIHLVLATQRPSIDVITGLIKANIPSRIAFMVASKFDSRIIIDAVGAEKLLGKGDMLISSAWDAFPSRMQGAFVSEEEVERVVEHVKTLGEPDYIDDEMFIDDEEEDSGPTLFDDEDDDPLFEKALEIVLQQGKASASYIQRRLKIGYNRAARLVELMEEKGIVGPSQGSKPRDLVRNPEVLGRFDAGRSLSPGQRELGSDGGEDTSDEEAQD